MGPVAVDRIRGLCFITNFSINIETMKKAVYFDITELVCKDVFERDGEKSWRYFRPVLIDFLDWIRAEWERPVYVNNWKWGGAYDERGLRCNLCPLVKNKDRLYVSAHILGAGVDFNIEGASAHEIRAWLNDNICNFFSKFKKYAPRIRIESGVFAPSWVHVDFYEHNEPEIIQYFKP